MTKDEELLDLSSRIRETPVDGSHMAKVWMRTGLNIAAEVIERRRIELLIERLTK